MEEIFTKIQLMSKKKVFAFVIFFLIFEAIFIFPLKYELSIINAVMIYCYFMLGFVLCAVTRRKPVIICLGIGFSNMIGLGLRVWLEWGEYSMVRDLNFKNVLLTYIPIITIVFIGYLYTKYYIQGNPKTIKH